ncbi:MAG: glycosyltransferase family 2 protein [Elusimicrobia bacterium]|nr:glycosyltransferase family 2 protein [Elusimicrobiota bacterium]
MDSDKKVTVITPTRNRLESLKKAIASLKAQTHRNWEHLIVSDGYDPRVRRLVESLGDPRVRFLFTPSTKCGGNPQRNLALKLATGEYVFGLDDDNLIEVGCIEKMAAAFVDESIGYATCHILYDGVGIMAPRPPFVLKEIDGLNFMVRTRLAREAGGWLPLDGGFTDFHLIEKVSRVSRGAEVPEVLGWHRRLEDEPADEEGWPLLEPLMIGVNRALCRLLCGVWPRSRA